MSRRFPIRVATPRRIAALAALLTLAACGGEQVTTPRIAGPSAAEARIENVPATQTVVVRWSAACLQAIRLARPAPTVTWAR